MSYDFRLLTALFVSLVGLSVLGFACNTGVDEDINPDDGLVDAEEPSEVPRFSTFVVGNNTCYMALGYFPKSLLSEMLPDHLTIPDDATMSRYYPETPLVPDAHPFMLSFCHGWEIHDVFTEVNFPDQEEQMFVFPVVYTDEEGGKHLCSYLPVLYLDSERAVEGGHIYGLRKEYHPEMMHGEDNPNSKWWSIEDIIEASFFMLTDEELAELPNFFNRAFANPFVTISFPPESRTIFYETTVYTNVIRNATGTFNWNYRGTTVHNTEETQSIFSDYSFTMSVPMTGDDYFKSADE